MLSLNEMREQVRERLLSQGSCPQCGKEWIAALGEIYYCPADCGWEVNLFDDEEVLRQAALLTGKSG